MGDSFKWNEGNLNELISELNSKKEALSNQSQSLATLRTKIGNVWRGNEYKKAEARILETEKALSNAIDDVSRQITYLEQKNNAFSNIRSGL